MDINLKVLGHPVLRTAAQEHPLRAERRHQLLAYLACRDGWVPRAELAALFWEDHPTEAARRNLRRLLHDIRRIPWLAGFESHGDALRWQVPSDRTEFARACAARDWRDAVGLGAGVLLEGLDEDATEPFHEWLRCERERHVRQWRNSVANRRKELRDDLEARIDLALFVLKHDTYDEDAIRDMSQALQALGRADEARRNNQEFVQRLRRDLGVAPVVMLGEQRCAQCRWPTAAERPNE
jgi:DNA-binding SARP family transcriptional activator